MNKPTRKQVIRLGVLPAVLVVGLSITAGACEDDSPGSKATGKESKSQQDQYARLAANQPAHSGSYSPTRETINAWIDTWMKKPGKKSYVYIQNANGEYGYYILKGLPVSYCASITPTYKLTQQDLGGNNGKMKVPAPGMDGAYYSGTQCNSYYGMDAESGAYLEFTVGTNQSYFLYDQPMDPPQYKNATPMGPSKIKN